MTSTACSRVGGRRGRVAPAVRRSHHAQPRCRRLPALPIRWCDSRSRRVCPPRRTDQFGLRAVRVLCEIGDHQLLAQMKAHLCKFALQHRAVRSCGHNQGDADRIDTGRARTTTPELRSSGGHNTVPADSLSCSIGVPWIAGQHLGTTSSVHTLIPGPKLLVHATPLFSVNPSRCRVGRGRRQAADGLTGSPFHPGELVRNWIWGSVINRDTWWRPSSSGSTRLGAALAAWEIQAHRTLPNHHPDPADLVRVVRVQALIARTT
jgi:hypothetical protein